MLRFPFPLPFVGVATGFALAVDVADVVVAGSEISMSSVLVAITG